MTVATPIEANRIRNAEWGIQEERWQKEWNLALDGALETGQAPQDGGVERCLPDNVATPKKAPNEACATELGKGGRVVILRDLS